MLLAGGCRCGPPGSRLGCSQPCTWAPGGSGQQHLFGLTGLRYTDKRH